jgi:mRNA-degrading endonuclease RelE of RelBE toxin-antitoxin system
MSYSVIPTPDFKKFFKKLYKKHPSLKNDLAELIEKLEDNYAIGIFLGNNLYKIRLAIESKNKGKSAGARIIYFFLDADNEIYLIHIFDKSQFKNIPKHVLLDLLKNAGLL